MTATTTPATRSTRRLGLAGIALAAGLLVVGCSSTGSTTGTDAAAKPKTTTTAGTSTSSTTSNELPTLPDASPTGQPTPTPEAPAPAPAPEPQPAPQPEPAPQPTGAEPVITSFVTPDDIDCHNGDLQMFTASWSTEHATSVTISIDGPGAYRTYGPVGEDSLPFNCSSAHTFLLTATGPGGSASRSITLQPRNVQGPGQGEGESEGMGEGEGY